MKLSERMMRREIPFRGFRSVYAMNRDEIKNEVVQLEDNLAIYKVLRNSHKNHRRELKAESEALIDALNHCGYDPDDCIDCGESPHNEWCRFWKVRHLLSYWNDTS